MDEKYIVILYDAKGSILKDWVTKGIVTYRDGFAFFEDETTGREITISGTIVVEARLA